MSFPDCLDFFHGCELCYFGSGAMPGSLIVFGGLSLSVLYGLFTKAVRKNRARQLAPHFWRLSLGVLYVLEKPI